MSTSKFLYVPVMLFFLVACGGTREIMVEAPPMEETLLDTMVVSAPPITPGSEKEELPEALPHYNASASRYMDLLHTNLDLRFDWKNQHVLGKASITMSPVFYPQEMVRLDAKGFDIGQVSVAGKLLPYKYDGRQLEISLDRSYNRNEEVTIVIDYIAKPNEGPEGGSAAITSDKGLFFINPLREDPSKPMQIWTQGETENNSRWFPTFDKPNERMTQEVSLTVEDRFETLSNGLLISSVQNSDGTRTDTWRQEKPHAPYLFMLAIGPYAVVRDKWEDIELMYYVEEPFRPYAKDIFNHTPEMLSFFSAILDYPYPWDKYAQVVCRDYVSGAMENTTAVIFGEFVQKTGRELIDNDNDYIVAHEMFHHWFGDLVTCESWANLTLQEGFANYAEYLWYEYKYGKNRAEAHRMSEMEGYVMSAQGEGTHPLIHYQYEDKEQMFDAHSYNKGGLVLHMLRNYVGDEAFFASLNKYLTDNAFTAVEVDELRMAFEDVTGIDLQWFFRQWYLSPGHPTLDITYVYDTLARKQIIRVEQKQKPEEHLPVYRLEVDIAVYDQEGSITFYPATLDKRHQEFIIEDLDQPAVVVFDGTNSQLAVINEKRSPEENLAIYLYSQNFRDKYLALRGLRRGPYLEEITDLLLEEDYYSFRQTGIESLSLSKAPELKEKIEMMVVEDPHSSVRAAALKKLAEYDYAAARPLLIRAVQSTDAFPVVAAALETIYRQEPDNVLNYTGPYQQDNAAPIVAVLAEIFAASGDAQYLSYFEEKLSSVSLFTMFNFYSKYYDLLESQSPDIKLEAAKILSGIGLNDGNMFRKFVATSTINKIKESLSVGENDVQIIKIQQILDEIISNETNDQLLYRYRSF